MSSLPGVWDCSWHGRLPSLVGSLQSGGKQALLVDEQRSSGHRIHAATVEALLQERGTVHVGQGGSELHLQYGPILHRQRETLRGVRDSQLHGVMKEMVESILKLFFGARLFNHCTRTRKQSAF